jgi:hypothetical protein
MDTRTHIALVVALALGGCDAFGWDEAPADTLTVAEIQELEGTTHPGPDAVTLEEIADAGAAELTVEELQDLWFGDSGWGCCYTSLCAHLRADKCDDDEVPATNGATVCCVPDIGQCPVSDSDGGA